ncbi:MAG: dihydroorotate dehydrogenase electron transfer subunit [Lachnospiraceae bacterium]
MAEKFKEQAVILSQEELAAGIFSMWLQTEQIAGAAVPGQFISVYSRDSGRLLPRPISICEIDRERGAVRIVYRVAGKGTDEFCRYHAGVRLDILGPLGNGFPMERCPKGKKAFLIGGGIGIPPMVQLAKELEGEAEIIAGYRDSQLFLSKELQTYGTFYAATEDGSVGTKGNVLDCIRENGLSADVIYACGPTPMLRALKAYAQEQGIECWISMEEKMACGIGACLACVCKSKETDEHSKVHNKRVCKEGPVFLADDVEL